MRRMAVLLVILVGCDSSDDGEAAPEPGALISGELVLERDGEPVAVMFGSMLDFTGFSVLSFADVSQCSISEDEVTFYISTNLGEDIDGNRDYNQGPTFNFYDTGIVVEYPTGQLHLTEVNATTVLGDLVWGGRDPTGDHTYTLAGTFEIGRCRGSF